MTEHPNSPNRAEHPERPEQAPRPEAVRAPFGLGCADPNSTEAQNPALVVRPFGLFGPFGTSGKRRRVGRPGRRAGREHRTSASRGYAEPRRTHAAGEVAQESGGTGTRPTEAQQRETADAKGDR